MYHEIVQPSTHAQKEITCSKASLHPSEQFYMHKNTSASVLIVWELIELTEYCQLLKKGSESALGSAQMYHKILPPSTHAQKEITCAKTSLHPIEQFYMHKNTSGSVLIVWQLIELTEYCQLLEKGSEITLEVRRCTTKFSHLPHMRRRRSPCGRLDNFVVHLRTSRALSEPFLSSWQYSVNSISSHTMSTLAEVFLCI